MTPLSVIVTKKTKEAEDIFGFELSRADGSPLPPFSAGAHIDVYIRDGLVRQYSLCNDPTEQHRYLIGVLRDPHSRGGSIAMHDGIAEGNVIRISEPRNHFPLTQARHSLLFAGGIGVTPILCMAERLAHIGGSFEMHYCTRSIKRTAFYERIMKSPLANHVHFHFDAGPPGQMMNLPALVARPDPDMHLYVCGPVGFIEFVTNTAKSQGWASEQIHYEYFSATPQDNYDSQAFEVQIASTGKSYMIPPDQRVTTVLASHGIEIPISCEQGVCGTCITRVLSGIPDHRDMYFTDAEHAKNDQFTPCCSRAKTNTLVLDL
jgi:vanillate O-demethylase ferredoxin subunit